MADKIATRMRTGEARGSLALWMQTWVRQRLRVCKACERFVNIAEQDDG